jgi:hypothetical protein
MSDGIDLNGKPSTGLREFGAFVTDYKSLLSIAALGTTAAPLADYIVKVGPPSLLVPLVTTVAQLVCLVSVFHFGFRRSSVALNRVMLGALFLLFAGIFGYLILFSSYTFRQPKTGDLEVKGFRIRGDILPLLNESYTEEDALKENRYEPAGVWTKNSITAAGVILVVVWLTWFVSLSTFLASFVILQGRLSGSG